MGWRTLALVAIGLGAVGAQDAPAAAQEAIRALLELKDGDEEGFDAQADRLLGLGSEALDPLEAALKGQTGEKAFRLRRIRDMIWYPLTLKGVYASHPGDSPAMAQAGIGPSAVVLKINGQAVSNYGDFSRVYQEASKSGQKLGSVEYLDKGRRRTVQVEGLWTRATIGEYPHMLAEYVHQGHRAAAWDDLVQKSIEPWRERDAKDLENLARAVEAGCRDSYVIYKVTRAQFEKPAPEEVVKLWKDIGAQIPTRAYGGQYHREVTFAVAAALFETGDLEGALKLNDETRKGFEAVGPADSLAGTNLQRAIFLEEKDPAQAVEIAKAAVARFDELRNHRCWRHHFLTHLRRVRGLYDDVAASAAQYGIDRDKDPAPLNDAHDMMARFQRRTTEIIPVGRLYPTEDALKKGRPAGLTGHYYKAPNFGGDPVVRIDPEITFRWGEGAPMPELPVDNFSVRWTGFVIPEFTDTYTFTVRVDDGAKLWIGDELVVDAWQDGAPRYLSGKAELVAGKAAPVKLEYFEHGGGAQVELFWDCPSFKPPAEPVPWTLVYRNTFSVDGTQWTFQDLPLDRLKPGGGSEAGKIRLSESGETGVSPAGYASVRIEADVQMKAAGGESLEGDEAGLRAWIDPVRGTEIGFGHDWPRTISTYLYFGHSGPSFYSPRIDLRKSHRLALEAHRGQATYFVDGRKLDFQFVPGGWNGFWGIKVSAPVVELSNLEVYVPAPGAAADTDRLRGLYDRASSAAGRGDLPAALGSLEEAAALQPRVEELGRLYGAYLLRGPEARKLLDKRFLGVTHPQAFQMLLEAEQQIDLLGASEADCLQVRQVRLALDRGEPVDEAVLSGLKESGGTGHLALFGRGMEERYRRGVPGVSAKEVVASYRQAIAKDPRGLVLRYRLGTFLLTEHLADQAAPVLREVKERAPKVDPWKAAKDAKKP